MKDETKDRIMLLEQEVHDLQRMVHLLMNLMKLDNVAIDYTIHTIKPEKECNRRDLARDYRDGLYKYDFFLDGRFLDFHKFK